MAGRLQVDNSSDLVKSVALPNAANTVNTGVIDLGNNAPFPITEKVTVRVSTGLGTGANSKNINITLADSNESNANFTNIASVGVIVNAGNAANTAPAGSTNFALPPSTKRYIRATATGEANGGNSSDANLTVQLLF